MCHRFHLSFNALLPKLFSSASATKILACSAKHDTCAKPAVPRHEHPRTRPSFVFQWTACVQMWRLPLGVLGARLRRDRDGLRVSSYWHYTARRRLLFLFLTELVMAAFFPVLHLAFRPAVARAAAAAFLAQG